MIDYIKYLYSFPWPFISYNTFKNNVKWSETAVEKVKQVNALRKQTNKDAWKAQKKKKLPVIEFSRNRRFSPKIQLERGKTLAELSIESDMFTELNPWYFAPQYIEAVKIQRLIKIFKSH